MPALREQSEMTAARVCAEFRQTRSLPGPFRRWLRVRHGIDPDYVTAEQVDRRAREWSDRFLAAVDAGVDPERVD